MLVAWSTKTWKSCVKSQTTTTKTRKKKKQHKPKNLTPENYKSPFFLALRDITKFFILQHYTNSQQLFTTDIYTSSLEIGITVREQHPARYLLLYVSNYITSQDQQQNTTDKASMEIMSTELTFCSFMARTIDRVQRMREAKQLKMTNPSKARIY